LARKIPFIFLRLTPFGAIMSLNPFDAYKEFDPKLLEQYEKLQGLAYSEGALTIKLKLLIALAIDVENGALQGAIAIGHRALKMGASREEIVEALRISYQIGGNRAFFTSTQVVQALFKQK
jgi:alkylhydroperoxidase/carboxymuconolactone decarboxylase family protein YurZ